MAWDFETEPEFQRELDWMDAFVREEIEPLQAAKGRASVHIAKGAAPPTSEA